MTEYGQIRQKPTPLLSYDHVQERKAARRKLLAQVEQRRKQQYLRWYRKMRLQATREIDIIS